MKSRLDFAVADLGLIQLKNIAEPMRIYSLEVGKRAMAKPDTVPGPETSAPPRLSIVVLPFKNAFQRSVAGLFSPTASLRTLTTDLSRIRNSFVIARNTAFTFKDKAVDAKQIAKELGK